jgi:YVTN family beta-propeller protein
VDFVKNGAELWVSAEIGETVTVFNTAVQTELAKIRFEIPGVLPELIQPVGFALTKDETTAFVALGPANHVAVVNAETYAVERYILTGHRVWHMAFNADETKLFATNGGSSDVTVINVADEEAKNTIAVGRFPWGAALRVTV